MGTHLNCIDKSMQFKWVPTAYVFISSPELKVLMVSYCGQSMSVVHLAASTIALKANSSYIPVPFDSILGRKHRGDL